MPAVDIPRWVIVLGSVLIIGHLLAIGCSVMAAPSGPWPVMGGGQTNYLPPQFAAAIADWFRPKYLEPMKMTHTYHFNSNNPEVLGVYLVFKLKDGEGREVATVKLPDDNANYWVRQRQRLLALALGNDQPIAPPPAELVAAPGRQVPKVLLWEMDGSMQKMRLKKVDQNVIPRDQPQPGPPELSMLLARSYARHLCRVHGAVSAELYRHHQSAVPPVIIPGMTLPPGALDESVSYFGEITFKPGSFDVISNFGETSR
jgi:hypothetical protein